MQNTIDHPITAQRIRRSRRNILIVFAAILTVTGLLFIYMLQVENKRASEHKHSFMQYVVSNHLGSLTEIDTGTGLDPMSYILTVDHVIPDANREPMIRDLSQRYYDYDHGQTLTIVYVDPATHKQLPVAEATYDNHKKLLIMTVTLQSGQAKQIVQPAEW